MFENVAELKTIRHEFGHVIQHLWRHMVENEAEYKGWKMFYREIMKHLHISKVLKLNGTVMNMNKYVKTDEWE